MRFYIKRLQMLYFKICLFFYLSQDSTTGIFPKFQVAARQIPRVRPYRHSGTPLEG